MERFRRGLVCQAHRLLYDSTLGLSVIKKKKGECVVNEELLSLRQVPVAHRRRRPPRPLCRSEHLQTCALSKLSQHPQSCQSTPKLVSAVQLSAHPQTCQSCLKIVRAPPKWSKLSVRSQTCHRIPKLVTAIPKLSEQSQSCQRSPKVVRALSKLTCAPPPLWRGWTVLYVPYSLDSGEQCDEKRLGRFTLQSCLLKIRRIEACQLIR